MPTFTFSGGAATNGFNMGLWNPGFLFAMFSDPSRVGQVSATQFHVLTSTSEFNATGTFGNLDANNFPQSGTIQTLDYATNSMGGVVTMSITGLSIPVASFRSWTLSNNVEAFRAALFDGNDTMTGGAFDEAIYGYGGVDTINGAGGNDNLVGGLGNDTLNGGDGDDWLDVLGIGEGNDILNGGAGNDRIVVRGIDTVDGGDGMDVVELELTSGSISLSSAGFNTSTGVTLSNGVFVRNAEYIALQTGAGNDTFTLVAGGAFATQFYAGDGLDTLVADFSASSETYNLVPFGFGLIGNFSGVALDNVERYVISTGSGNDRLRGSDGNDILSGGGGNDEIEGGGGTNTLNGGSGDDIIFSTGTDTIDGGAGIDTLRLVDSSTSVINWNNLFLLSSYNGTTFQSIENFNISGNDFLISGTLAGGGLMYGGNLTANMSTSASAVTVDFFNLQSNGHTVYLGITGSRNITGGAVGDSLTGGDVADTLNGGAGNDTLDGYRGTDILNGGDGDDTLTYLAETGWGFDQLDGGAGTDTAILSLYTLTTGLNVNSTTFTGAGVTFSTGAYVRNVELLGNLSLTSGDDTFDARGGYLVGTTYVGGLGFDILTADFTTWAGAISSLSFDYFTVGSVLFAAFEQFNIIGGGGDDSMIGGSAHDVLDGGGGNDTLTSSGGADSLDGGAGIDLLTLNLGATTAGADYSTVALRSGDWVTFADGTTARNFERIFLTAGSGADTLTVDSAVIGANAFFGGAGIDTFIADWSGIEGNINLYGDSASLLNASFFFSGVERFVVTGTALGDGLRGSTGNDVFNGADGNDVLAGAGGANTLNGGNGDDFIESTGVGDIINGGAGSDMLSLDLSASATPVNLSTTQLTAPGGFTLANGTSVENVEKYFVTLGAGADTFTVTNMIAGNNAVFAGGGIDTLIVDLSAATTRVTYSGGAIGIDPSTLTTGDFELVTIRTGSGDDYVGAASSSSHTIYTGAGNDLIIAGFAVDVVYAGDGADTIESYGGGDTLYGGLGNDLYRIFATGVTIGEDADAGIDLVQSQITFTLGANLENLTLTGSANIDATGNALANIIFGNSGHNQIDGRAGADQMTGGFGDDTYFVDNGGDVVTENASEGTDTIRSTVGVAALAANVENLVLLATAVTGNGNGLNNIITGNASNNFINGLAGADTMIGGLGNDTYFIDNAGDVVTELSGEGTDTIFSTITIAALAQQVENLTLSGTALNANGNFLNNIITGNAQKNTLNGGAGEDTLIGGLDSDTYIYNSLGDVITENLNEGLNDAVIAFIDVTALMDNVENVTLAGTATSATGNDLSNILTGNSLDNFLYGGLGNDQLNGAVGADTMTGGQGDDAYLVENLGDVVIEASGEGNDVIYAWVNIAALADNVERATIIGAGNLNITGNALNNRLNGNDNNNTLVGLDGEDIIGGLAGTDVIIGGAGRDLLTGGAGADTFVYQALSDSGVTGSSRDIIYDFVKGQDLIDLVAIDAISGGGDDAFNFIGNSAFSNTAGELRYEVSAGYTIISLDVNGDGIADSQITLVGNVPLTSSDFGL